MRGVRDVVFSPVGRLTVRARTSLVRSGPGLLAPSISLLWASVEYVFACSCVRRCYRFSWGLGLFLFMLRVIPHSFVSDLKGTNTKISLLDFYYIRLT